MRFKKVVALPQGSLAASHPQGKNGAKKDKAKQNKVTSTLPTEDVQNPYEKEHLPMASPEKLRKITEIHGHKLAVTS
jgi:hypothetical protein